MDKAEYQLKLEELTMYADRQDYKNALRVAESIDWRRVKSIRTLSMVADIYEVNKDYKSCKNILLLAYDRASIGKSILYRLTEISLKLGDLSEAEDFYQEYASVAANDNSRYLLQYKIKKAQRAPLADQIATLEEYKEREYTERWAYELASLYHKAGDRQKCLETCDDLILWFSEGKYVVKAMELKMKYEPLTPSQQKLYDQERYLYSTKGQTKGQTGEQASEESEDGESKGQGRSFEQKAAQGRSPELKTDLAYGVQTSRDFMERLDQAGAAITKDVAVEEGTSAGPLMGDAVDEYPVTSREFMGKTANLREQLAKSIHDVFSGVKREASQVKDLVRGDSLSPESPVEEEELPEDFPVQDLEPEQVETEVKLAPDAAKTILSRPEKANKSEEKSEEAPAEQGMEPGVENPADLPVENMLEHQAEAFADQARGDRVEGQMSFEDFDLDALLQETASSFSQELAGETGEASESGDGLESPNATDGQPVEEGPEAVEGQPVEEGPEAVKSQPVEEVPETAEGQPVEEGPEAIEDQLAEEIPEVIEGQPSQVLYNEELEIPDPEPTPAEKLQRTIPLSKLGQNTVPISIEDVLREETPEERRIRILNDAKPTRMSDEQRKIFTYFARIPGMDQQILEAIGDVYAHAGEHNSMHGNIAVMGAEGTGKSRLSYGLIVAMCRDLGLDAAKVARLKGSDINQKDPAKIVNKMAGGFLVIEEAGDMIEEKVKCLNQAMEFRTDCMILVIEDEKSRMRALLKKYPDFAAKFDKVISIPVFTNDELVTFARTYATENGCKMDEMGVLALYTLIGNNQSEQEPVTISRVKEMVDDAIHRAKRGKSKFGKRGASKDREHWTILHEKDFES